MSSRDPDSPRCGPPSADALDASVCLARVRRRMFASVETPRIAHYQVLRPIGGGGMGLVFAAWDPTLDRVVAIKVLRDPWSPGSGSHLRREAIALARLRHPNVVSVFEVGDHDGQVYLAMEYVEGQTLRALIDTWKQQPRPDLRALLDVFSQAAHGLAAAHAADLVHRDVKPENIMIEADGRVRLMDFGLARREASVDTTPRTRGKSGPPHASSTNHSVSIGLYGTPAYMAPEQLDGTAPGPAADQFALCACMFEALYGRRARPDRLEAAAAVSDTPVQVLAERHVSRRLQAILRRGLAVNPAERWPSMRVLADELERLRRSRLHRWAIVASAIVATTGVFSGFAVASHEDSMCTGGDAHMAGVWDQARAQALESVVRRADAPFATQAWRQLVLDLDAYRSDWVHGHRDACEAAQVRREISTAQMDLRMACLRDRRRHLAALVDVVHHGGIEALAHAEEAAASLPSVASCSDADYVGQQGYDIVDSEVAQRVGERLARAAALHDSGDLEGARDTAADALAEAEAAGDDAAAARARLSLGEAQASLSESQEARDSLVLAYESARRADLPDVATEAAIALVTVCGVALSRQDEGLWWLRIAELEGTDAHEPRRQARRDLAAAALLYAAGRPREAVARNEAARALLRDTMGEHDRAHAFAQLQLGMLHVQTGALERGTELIDDATRSLREALGPQHPANARAQRALALAARIRGDMSKSVAYARRAVALAESAVGPDHISLSPHLESLANSLASTGAIDDALAVLDRASALSRPRPLHGAAMAQLEGTRGEALAESSPARSLVAYERAYEISRAAVGEQHRETVLFLVAKGAALTKVGHPEQATETLGLGLVLAKAVLGSQHPRLQMIEHDLALAYEHQGDVAKALEHNLQALDIARASYGRDGYALVATHANVCANLVHLERASEALTHCERALEISAGAVGNPARVHADLHNNLGAALLMLDRVDEAESAFTIARDVWRDALGPRSYEESVAIANLAEAAERHHELAKAAALYREALAIREAALGPDHPALNVPRDGLARCERRRSGRD